MAVLQGVTASSDITDLLQAWASGNASALEQLTPLVYNELRRVARRCMRPSGPQTLQTTALAHEAYLRLVGAEGLRWQDRAHFFAVAAQMMRRILVDAARSRRSEKRGGQAPHVPLEEAMEAGTMPLSSGNDTQILALNENPDGPAKIMLTIHGTGY